MSGEASVLSVDLGTSAAKLAVIDASGRAVARAEVPYPTRRAAGRAEQDPRDWERAMARGLEQLPTGFRAASFTGQMQDLILTRAGEPARRAILYSDVRATGQNVALRAEHPAWASALANEPRGDSIPAKLLWLRENEPDLAADRILLSPSGYLVERLTGRAACDTLTASTTSLVAAGGTRWLEDIVRAGGWDPDILPELVRPGLVGTVSRPLWGLPEGLPVVLDAGDAGATTAGVVGAGGGAYAYLGTSGWVASVRAGVAAVPWETVHRLAYGDDATLVIGAMASAGAAVAWSVREFFDGDWARADAALARVLADGGTRVLCVPGLDGERTAALGGEEIRGAFVGVHSGTTRAELHAAVMLGVAMNLAHLRGAVGADASEILPVTGGLTRAAPAVQALAAVLGPVRVVDARDASLLSCARTAFDALGVRHDLRALAGEGPVVAPTGRVSGEELARHRALIEALREA